MSADQIAEIAPLVREVLSASAQQAPGPEWCATFEVVGNSSAWAQVTASSVNFAYPHEDAPRVRLESVLSRLPDIELLSWEPGQYATFSFGPASATAVARVVDEALALLFELDEYSVDGQLERI